MARLAPWAPRDGHPQSLPEPPPLRTGFAAGVGPVAEIDDEVDAAALDAPRSDGGRRSGPRQSSPAAAGSR